VPHGVRRCPSNMRASSRTEMTFARVMAAWGSERVTGAHPDLDRRLELRSGHGLRLRDGLPEVGIRIKRIQLRPRVVAQGPPLVEQVEHVRQERQLARTNRERV